MGGREPIAENRKFGSYLRKIREERNLSLEAVEEMSLGLPEPVTKSHLSRIENGQAVPTFPRMFALSQVYGVPISSLAEKFETDLSRSMFPVGLDDRTDDDLLGDSKQLRRSGRYAEALVLLDAIIDRRDGFAENDHSKSDLLEIKANLLRIYCYIQLSRYVIAKEECESLLSRSTLKGDMRVSALHCFAMCCDRLGKYTFALMALEQADIELQELDGVDLLLANTSALKGNLFTSTGRPNEAITAYSEAIKGYESLSDSFEACRVRGNLAFALIECGKVQEARRQLGKVIAEAEAQGYDRQLAVALSNYGLLTYREGDLTKSKAFCLRSNTIARPREYISVIFRNCFYLWRVAQISRDEAGMKTNERSLRTYLSRVEKNVPEAREYRAYLAGGAA